MGFYLMLIPSLKRTIFGQLKASINLIFLDLLAVVVSHGIKMEIKFRLCICFRAGVDNADRFIFRWVNLNIENTCKGCSEKVYLLPSLLILFFSSPEPKARVSL